MIALVRIQTSGRPGQVTAPRSGVPYSFWAFVVGSTHCFVRLLQRKVLCNRFSLLYPLQSKSYVVPECMSMAKPHASRDFRDLPQCRPGRVVGTQWLVAKKRNAYQYKSDTRFLPIA